MNKAQVMISRGALKSYPTEIFELADIRVAFEALTERNPSTVAISMNQKGLGEKKLKDNQRPERDLVVAT